MVDVYTKAVLTVIAVAVTVIAVRLAIPSDRLVKAIVVNTPLTVTNPSGEQLEVTIERQPIDVTVAEPRSSPDPDSIAARVMRYLDFCADNPGSPRCPPRK